MKPDITLISTADWDNPFWTNKQHVACELARCGHRVLYVESLGLRRVSATAHDLSRIWGRLRKGLRPPRQLRDNLWVWSPLVIPMQRLSIVRALNRLLFGFSLRLWSRVLGIRRELLWTYYPLTTRYLAIDGFGYCVYHCVDEVKAQPGMPVEEIETAENDLVRQCDVCFVTAENLLASRKYINPNTHYFPNVADFAHFATARSESTAIPGDLLALPAPRVGFIGAISSYKLDLRLLARMAQRHPEWSIVMIGKIGEGEPWTDISPIEGLPNVHLIGPRAYAELPGYLKGFDVAILPSALNEYTRNMFPMKFFEYLAAGKPVVSTDLHALHGHRHVATLASDSEAFIAGVEAALRGEGPSLEARLDAAREQTYQRRTSRMMALVESGMKEKSMAAASRSLA
ncbi:MAG: glycosyltransferase [Burkholderiales bacterium]|nr:glycosyltransferase [Burkholderiales bacterium]